MNHIQAEIAERVRMGLEGSFTHPSTEMLAESILSLTMEAVAEVAPHAFVHRDTFVDALRKKKSELYGRDIPALDVADVMEVYDMVVLDTNLTED